MVESRFTQETCRELAASCLGLKLSQVELLETYPWRIAAWVADRYRAGRVLLAGDAVHSVPPHGGFGANTGIHDGHNLALKLAAVLSGRAPAASLDRYEAERRPVAELVVSQGTSRSAGRHGVRLPASAFEPLLEEDAITMGYRYTIGQPAVPNPIAFPPDRLHGEVGTRAPHVVLARDGAELSTLDLFDQDFTLLSGVEAADWADQAARWLSERGRPCRCIAVGRDYADVADRFRVAYGVTARGATLVRADGFVVWKAAATDAFDAKELASVLADEEGVAK